MPPSVSSSAPNVACPVFYHVSARFGPVDCLKLPAKQAVSKLDSVSPKVRRGGGKRVSSKVSASYSNHRRSEDGGALNLATNFWTGLPRYAEPSLVTRSRHGCGGHPILGSTIPVRGSYQ